MFKLNQTISCLALSAVCLSPLAVKAQLSSNQDKFLGNITTSYQVDYGQEKFYTLWNQITCENESKWGSVEGSRNSYNWGCDNAFNYAKNHNFTYKFHALVWGAQYPGWLESLTPTERYACIVKWYDAVKKKYSFLPMIDVVNEAIDGHQAGNPMMKESLGGGGKTGYDWLIKAFEMAGERFPNSILIYNDFNTFQWNTDQYITLVQAIRDGGAPIDAYGCQSHDLTDCSLSKFKESEAKIQNALKMPFYSTEYDIGTTDDALQLQRYKEQIPYMWEKPYCAGITLWGYIYGHTWTTDGNSGLIKESTVNGKKVYTDRPAMTWLREYMQTDAAKNAKSPFPGMKKRVGVYIKAKDFNVAKGDVVPIKVRTYITDDAKKEKTDIAIDSVLFYDETKLISKMTEEPYIVQYSSTTAGNRTLKAVVYTNDGNSYERYSRINVLSSTTKRAPYNGTPAELPGTLDAKEYDKGASGVSYYSATRSYTTATKDNGWMEYTVDVKEKGIYSFDVEVAATKTGGRFHFSEYGLDNLTFLSDYIDVPKTGSSSSAVQILHGVLKDTLTAGIHTICMNIEKGGFYVRSLTFNRYELDNTMTVTVVAKPATISVGDTTQLVVTTKLASGSTSTITGVNVYSNDLLIGTVTKSPDTLQYVPTAKGSYSIVAIATNSEGKSKTSSKKTLKVNGKRIPYKSTPIVLPGIIQAENFDKGGEGFTFHDKDSQNEGDASYRTDNEGLDLVKGNSGTAIGYTSSGEWTEYTVNVKEPGEYSFEATCSNGSSSNGGFTINTVKGTTVTKIGTVTVTPTGGWDTYKVIKGNLTKNLAEGEQILRFTLNSAANCNIDKVNFICTLNTGIEQVETLQPQSNVIYNLKGQKVDTNYKGIIIKNGRKVLKR